MATGHPVPDELQKHLTKMVEARNELRATIAEAHAERKALLNTSKLIKAEITDLLVAEVERQMGEVVEGVRVDIMGKMSSSVDELVHDLRARLGL